MTNGPYRRHACHSGTVPHDASVDQPLSEYASAIHDVLRATAHRAEDGRLVSTEPLYRFLLERFNIDDPRSRRIRTEAVRELTTRGLVKRDNVRSRAVELLEVSDTAVDNVPTVTYDAYAAAIDADGLDVSTVAHRRVEQAFLRRVLLEGKTVGPCAICGRILPADLLVAAHVKRRSELTREQRLNFKAVAMLACALGCDSLYEAGYIAVDATGVVRTSAVPPGALAGHLETLSGRTCSAHDPARASLFAEHNQRRFRNDKHSL